MKNTPAPPDATPMFCARVRVEQPDAAASFMREDYRHVAELLRASSISRRRMEFYAVCSNNLNVILAALDKAGEGQSP